MRLGSNRTYILDISYHEWILNCAREFNKYATTQDQFIDLTDRYIRDRLIANPRLPYSKVPIEMERVFLNH